MFPIHCQYIFFRKKPVSNLIRSLKLLDILLELLNSETDDYSTYHENL